MNCPHPSVFIPDKITAKMRSYAAVAEASGQLLPEQLEIIYDQKWFNLFVPVEYGGLDFNLKEGLQVLEALAWTDGSTGWTVTLCSGANFFVGFLDPLSAKEIFVNPKTCLAGSGHPSGVARKTKDGYVITGKWKYATGAPHATVFTVSCKLEGNGTDANGEPLTAAFWLHRNEVLIYPDWNTTGMIATASHSVEADNVVVPSRRLFIIGPGYAKIDKTVYRYPFQQFAEATLAINLSGVAMNFIDLAKIILSEKKLFENMAAKSQAKLDSFRNLFYESIAVSWDELAKNGSIAPGTLSQVSYDSRQLAIGAVQLVDSLYPYCGLMAAVHSSPVNRAWRDLHTASQHILLRPADE